MAQRTRGVCSPSVEREADFLEAVQVIQGVIVHLERRPWRTVDQLSNLTATRHALFKLVALARAQDLYFWEKVHNGLG